MNQSTQHSSAKEEMAIFRRLDSAKISNQKPLRFKISLRKYFESLKSIASSFS